MRFGACGVSAVVRKMQNDCATPLPVLRRVAREMRAGLAADGAGGLPMILTYIFIVCQLAFERMSRDTDLVEDPEAEEKARAVQNPWTPDEKETFVKKLTLLGKDFKKIASHIDGKTTADCVQFYYLNKKSGLFAWRKEQNKAPVVKDGGGAASCSSKSRGERKHDKKPAPAAAAAAELSGSEAGKRKRVQTEKVKQFIEAEKRSCSGKKMEIRRVKIKFGSRCFAPTHAGSSSAAGLIL